MGGSEIPSDPGAGAAEAAVPDQATAALRERSSWGAGEMHPGQLRIPVETAVALSYNGSSEAVMMASPADLEDFARGFTLTEGIARPQDILSVELIRQDQGIELSIWLADLAASALASRRRSRTGPVGCGLCGIESLAEALRPPPVVAAPLTLTPQDVQQAMEHLTAHQPLQDQTRAAHAAGFWLPGRGYVAVREDVGRHNALDKLAGALLAQGQQPGEGAVVITSRVSVDMVQKTARLGAPVLIAVSAPTTAAVDLADSCGLTLIARARGDRFDVFTHPHRIAPAPDGHTGDQG